MKLELFNVGWISSPAVVYRQGEDPSARIRFPIPAFLIETDDGERILIDTGLHPDSIADPAAFYDRPEAAMFELEQASAITDQIDVSTVDRIVLTHLHFDHAGALTLLPDSIPIVMQRREWKAAHDEEAIKRNFLYPRDYEIDEARLTLVDGDHDLLGDGSIELLFTPGHTPGHQSVRVGEGLVIGADVGHYAATLDDRRFPSFGDDLGAQDASAQRLQQLRESGIRVLPGHDPEVLRPGPVALS
jgi:N-acyl homoserine lactone hydrolase